MKRIISRIISIFLLLTLLLPIGVMPVVGLEKNQTQSPQAQDEPELENPVYLPVMAYEGMQVYQVNGNILGGDDQSLNGVTIRTGTGHSVVSNADGSFVLSGLSEGLYEVYVDSDTLHCSPVLVRINVPPNVTTQNFTCSTELYPVTGVIRDTAGNVVSDVIVTDNAGRSTTTDSSGAFQLLLPAGIHTITPTSAGSLSENNYHPDLFFEPSSITVRLGSTKIQAPLDYIEFTALASFMDPQNLGAVGLVAGEYPKLSNQGLVVDRSGNTYITYGTSSGLHFGSFDGTAWSFSVLDTVSTQYAAVTLDSKDLPQIAYFDTLNQNLKYIRATNRNAIGAFVWAAPRNADASADVGLVPTIKTDINNCPHIVYLDDTNDDLKYAYLRSGPEGCNFGGNNFQIESVTSSGNDILETLPSLSLDSTDTPHISFYQFNQDTENGGLMYGVRSSTDTWNIRTLAVGLFSQQFIYSFQRAPVIYSLTDIFQDAGFFNQIAIDDFDNVHVAYFNDNGDSLEYAYKWSYSSIFNFEPVDQFESVGAFTSLGIDSKGRPHIAYIRQSDLPGTTGGAVKYAIRTGSGVWKNIFVDTIGAVPYIPAGDPEFPLRTSTTIYMDEADNPHLLYYDFTTSDLKYAVRNKWEYQVVGLVGTLVEPSNRNIVLDSWGLPHIAFGGSNLYHGYYDGTTWQFELVDPSPTAGGYASIAMDEDDNIYISYYDSGPMDLKFASLNRRSGFWTIETVDSTGDVGKFNSLVLDYNNKPHISYFDETDDELWYALKSGNSWAKELLDSSGAVGAYTSIAVNSLNQPRIAYTNFVDYHLKYIVKDAHGWGTPTIIPTGGRVLSFVSLILNDHGLPNISYFEDANDTDTLYDNLKFAYSNGSRWIVDTIDKDNSVGWWNSMRMDSYGDMHLSYYDRSTGMLKYASGSLYDWQAEFVDSMGTIPDGADITLFGGYTSLVLDKADRPQMIYYDITNNVLRFAKLNQWEFQTAASPGVITEPGRPNLAVDIAGLPHIAYSDGNVNYIANDGFIWSTATNLGVGGFPTLAVNYAGVKTWPYVSWYDTTNQNLMYNFEDGFGWLATPVTVDDSPEDVGSYASLTIEQSGTDIRVHIAYFDETNDNLKYATFLKNSRTARVEVVDSTSLVGSYPSIALDRNGVPCISYYDIKDKNLKFAVRVGNDQWSTELVDSVGKVGLYSSLAIDSVNRPHIAYFDDTTDDLIYTYKSGGFWQFDVIDTVDSTGWYASLALDNNDVPHIAYYDHSNQNLKHAFIYRYNFVIELVDIAGDVGQFSSLKIDSANGLHIAYYDATLGTVKYARGIDW